jgi:hypothetical protein
MALRKTYSVPSQEDLNLLKTTELISPGDRLRAFFAMMEEGAPGPGEDDDWEALKASLNEGRSEENKLFRDDE